MSSYNKQSSAKKDPLADYITVAERVDKFYEDFPAGRINSTIIEHDSERGFILMRAEVFRTPDDAFPSATGHAYETRDAGFVNKTSYIENCETGAVGRALANLGYETKRGLAVREADPRPNLSAVPANTRQQQQVIEAEAPAPGQTIAETTIQSIRSLAQRKGIDVDAQLRAWGKPTLGLLSVTEADKLTEWLDGKPDPMPVTEPPANEQQPQSNGTDWVCGEDLKRSILDFEAACEELGIYKKVRDKLEVTHGTRNPSKLTPIQATSYKGYLIEAEREAREQQNRSNPLM